MDEGRERTLGRWVHQSIESLTQPPAPLTRQQTVLMIVTTIVVAATRVWARSKTLWDWDEALFSLAIRDYNVAAHQPHPPGFPAFVGLGKVVDFFIDDPFRSLQIVSLASAWALFPLVFWFARECRFPFSIAFNSALITAFLPTIWFYGGTAFSDIASLTFVFAAAATYLSSCRDHRWFIIASSLAAIAIGIRSQNFGVLFPCLLVATFVLVRRRSWLVVIGGTVVLAAGVGLAYGAAIHATGADAYFAASAGHKEYIRRVDSVFNPGRPSLGALAETYFLTSTRAGATSYWLALAGLLGVLAGFRRRALSSMIVLATFVPFALLAWFVLDHLSIGRFAVAYVPMYAIFAAAGIHDVARFAGRRSSVVEMATAGATLLFLAGWSIPAISKSRSTASPPHAAAEWIRRNVDPQRHHLFVAAGLAPHGHYLLPDYRRETVENINAVPITDRPSFLLSAEPPVGVQPLRFRRKRGRLWKIVRRFYFDAYVTRMDQVARYTSGWHDPETNGDQTWRWMGRRASLALPHSGNDMDLTLTFMIPTDLTERGTTVKLTLDGRVIAERRVSEETSTWRERVRVADVPHHELILETSHAINPAREGISTDGRDLGLQLWSTAWKPAE